MVISVVVSYNSASHLALCLASLEAQQGAATNIHVVDNASSDQSAELVRRDFPRVRLTANASNVGFARANNQVLERERAEYYALVNPDAILPVGALAACVEYLRREPKVWVVATRLVFPDGTLQPSCHSFLGLRNLLGETLGIHRAFPNLRVLSSLHMPWFRHDQIAEVDWIQGAFLVVRGDVVRQVGAFDPDFFMYGEEMDWCLRIRDAGWTVVFLPEPPVEHVGGGSSDRIVGTMFVENLKGRIRFLRKHQGLAAATAARGLIATSVFLRFAWREVQWLWLRLTGQVPDDALRLKQSMFRAATRWVLRGLPLSSTGRDRQGPS